MRTTHALGDYAGAIAAAKKVLKLKPDDESAAQMLSDAQAKLKEEGGR